MILSSKIPRGVIYHKLIDSLIFFILSFFCKLQDSALVKNFELLFAKYNKAKYCIAFPFARTAIYYSLKSQNFPAKSKILMPPITIKGILDVVLELNLIPVFVEIDLKTLSFDLEDLLKKIDANTKAALITPLFGLVPDYKKIITIMRKNNIFVVEDFSQCLNGRYSNKRVGSFGDISVYSSSSIKTLDTLGGGLALTNNEKLCRYLKKSQEKLLKPSRVFLIKKSWVNLIRNLATSKPFFILTFYFLQILKCFSPNLILKQTGSRDKKRLSRLPNIWFTKYTSFQASIGIKYLNLIIKQDKLRIKNVYKIKSSLPERSYPNTTNNSYNVYWQFVVFVNDSLYAQRYFSKKGIDIATTSLELISSLNYYPGNTLLPRAEYAYKNAIFLPCYHSLNESEINKIITSIKKFDDFKFK